MIVCTGPQIDVVANKALDIPPSTLTDTLSAPTSRVTRGYEKRTYSRGSVPEAWRYDTLLTYNIAVHHKATYVAETGDLKKDQWAGFIYGWL